MKPAILNEVKTVYIVCPDCGKDDGFEISHLFDERGRHFGPWSCNECGLSIKGSISSNDEVTIEIVNEPRQRQGLMLVRIAYDGCDEPDKEQIYLVFDEPISPHNITELGDLEENIHQYWVDEHTCPTNILGNLAIIQGDAIDPHGVLEHIQTIFKPDDFDEMSMVVYEDWATLFDKLPHQTIEGSVVKPSVKFLN